MPPPFRSVRVRRKRGAEVALHAHEESQLICAASGTLQVHTATGRWMVPPALAVWIPTRVPHRVEVVSDVELQLVYWSPQATAAWGPAELLARAFALRMTPLLRELFDVVAVADAGHPRGELAVRLMLQELTAADDAPTYLPLPASLAGRQVADRVLLDPANRLSLEELARQAAISARSLSRLFPAETGLTFKAWRQRARIAFAIERLAAGLPVQRIAHETGFANAAAFAFAFRQVTMMSPTEFQRRNACHDRGDDGHTYRIAGR